MIRKSLIPIFIALAITGCVAGDKNSSAKKTADTVRETQEFNMVTDTLLKYKYTEYADMAEPVCEYELEVTDSPNSAVLTITNAEVDSWFRWVPIEVLQHVQEMLIEANVETLKPSYHNDNVMDGYSWVFAADYASGEHLSSSGTNAGPRDRFKKINEYLDSVYRDAENKVK